MDAFEFLSLEALSVQIRTMPRGTSPPARYARLMHFVQAFMLCLAKVLHSLTSYLVKGLVLQLAFTVTLLKVLADTCSSSRLVLFNGSSDIECFHIETLFVVFIKIVRWHFANNFFRDYLRSILWMV